MVVVVAAMDETCAQVSARHSPIERSEGLGGLKIWLDDSKDDLERRRKG
jgi:hypothetical protein